jgi:hypothetical protein
MGKLYAIKKYEKAEKLKPKKETVSFLLNYSKALNFVTVGKMKIETIAN